VDDRIVDDTASHRDFFISRADADKGVAKAVAQILRAAGFTTWLQDEDFGSASFMARMAQGWSGAEGLICLLSRAYQQSEHCKKEYEVALKDDPRNLDERVIVLRVEDCAPIEHLADLAYTDLVPILNDAEALARVVLGAVAPDLNRADADFAVLHRRAPQIVHHEVREVPGFAGREVELAALEAALWRKGGTAALTDAPASAAAVKGLGGVGKSVLAKEYAWRNRARYQGIWWVRAERRETLADDLIELGARFIPGLKEVPERNHAARRALDWIEQAGFEKPWLLVYDNVEEPGRIEGLTPRAGAQVIVTTRWSDWDRGSAVTAASVAVGVFPPEVAADFLLEGTGRNDRAGAESLAAALGHLPLALDHAAAYVRRTGIDLATYEALAGELLQKALKGVDYDTPVFATFSLAIDKASETCPEAQKLMGLCAFLAPDRIPLSLFTDDVLSEIARGEAVAALQEVSLATLEPLDDGSPGLTMHRLVQATMRGRLKEMGEHENAAALATELAADAFPSGDPNPHDVRAWPACARLIPHAMAVFAYAPDSGQGADKTAHLLNQAALNFISRAAYAEAEPLLRRALAVAELCLGPDVAGPLCNLAYLLHATNRSAQAEPLMRRALSITEENRGRDHPDVATNLNNLAPLLQQTGRLQEAEFVMRRALAIDEANLGADHPSVARDLNNLAQVLKVTDRLAEAEPLIRLALVINEARLGPNHPEVAIHLRNLAEVLQATNRLAEAERLVQRALAISETQLGADHPQVALALNCLARVLKATDQLSEAEPLLRRAAAILEKFERDTGHRHPQYEAVLENLAVLEAATRAGRTPAPTESGNTGSAQQGLTPTPAAPQPPVRKRGFMGGLFPRRA
jgi:tetratricopeptide (TPR) repeat protein